MTKIKSFGCSFFYGNDLHDDLRDEHWSKPSNYTWPALIAKQLSWAYECYAKPGSGNLQILEKILTHAAIDNSDTVYLINWTWSERFDYIQTDLDPRWRDEWVTICPVSQSDVAAFYYRHLHSEPRDKLTSLIHIRTAIDILQKRNIKFFMTFMDDTIFDRRWHAPLSITHLQDWVKPYLHTFDGDTFLEWSKCKNFKISETLHPLEEAHAEAARYMLPAVNKLLYSA